MKLIKKILNLIDLRYKRLLLPILLLMFVGAIFEALGIGIIIPALNVITNENPIKEYPYLIFFTDIFDAYGEDDLLTIIIIFIVLIYTFKFLYLSFLYFIQSHLCHKIQASLSENILSNYLSKPYSFHINSNSSIFLCSFILILLHKQQQPKNSSSSSFLSSHSSSSFVSSSFFFFFRFFFFFLLFFPFFSSLCASFFFFANLVPYRTVTY